MPSARNHCRVPLDAYLQRVAGSASACSSNPSARPTRCPAARRMRIRHRAHAQLALAKPALGVCDALPRTSLTISDLSTKTTARTRMIEMLLDLRSSTLRRARQHTTCSSVEHWTTPTLRPTPQNRRPSYRRARARRPRTGRPRGVAVCAPPADSWSRDDAPRRSRGEATWERPVGTRTQYRPGGVRYRRRAPLAHGCAARPNNQPEGRFERPDHRFGRRDRASPGGLRLRQVDSWSVNCPSIAPSAATLGFPRRALSALTRSAGPAPEHLLRRPSRFEPRRPIGFRTPRSTPAYVRRILRTTVRRLFATVAGGAAPRYTASRFSFQRRAAGAAIPVRRQGRIRMVMSFLPERLPSAAPICGGDRSFTRKETRSRIRY
jgi:hypothetical protein